MATTTFGGFNKRTGFTTVSMYSTASVPSSPYNMADGTNRIEIDSLYGALSGNGGSRTATMYCGSSSVGISVGSAGTAADTGWISSSAWIVAGGTGVNYGYTSLSGSCLFARGADGTGFTQGAFGTWSASIGMIVNYLYTPSAPSITSVTPSTDGTSATVVVGAPGDNGGSSITGYRVQYALTSAFTTVIATVNTSGTATITGLTPGTTYFYRPTARNGVTDGAGTLGSGWGTTASAAQPDPGGLGRVDVGGTFTASDGKRYNGSSWDVMAGKRYNGSTWDDLGN